MIINNFNELEKNIIENGVKILKDFGYINVDNENIFTDYVYKKFFKGMLKSSLEETTNKTLLQAVKNILLKLGDDE